ncbi:GD22213 [Drosophila simulans]|uniref:GD22213 n=1 Tax=Drosophila simulans TaxID=7240 RepID=B4Q9V9_DROSI|nr:GD22213 [Drosophila simulans]
MYAKLFFAFLSSFSFSSISISSSIYSSCSSSCSFAPCTARCFSDNESVIECHITDNCDAAKWTMPVEKQQGAGIRKNVQENCHSRRKSCSSGLQRSETKLKISHSDSKNILMANNPDLSICNPDSPSTRPLPL